MQTHTYIQMQGVCTHIHTLVVGQLRCMTGNCTTADVSTLSGCCLCVCVGGGGGGGKWYKLHTILLC